jgi:YHS domain-containing protein
MKISLMRFARAQSRFAIIGSGLLLASVAVAPAFAGDQHLEGAVNTGYFGNVAIEGYDTVAYFTDGKATKGSEQYRYDWLGASWHFATEEHRKLFEADPIAYAPQFGGLCAEGVVFKEITVNIEPEVWEIIDGKLYLTSGAEFTSDMKGNRPVAEENWPEVEAALTQ